VLRATESLGGRRGPSHESRPRPRRARRDYEGSHLIPVGPARRRGLQPGRCGKDPARARRWRPRPRPWRLPGPAAGHLDSAGTPSTARSQPESCPSRTRRPGRRARAPAPPLAGCPAPGAGSRRDSGSQPESLSRRRPGLGPDSDGRRRPGRDCSGPAPRPRARSMNSRSSFPGAVTSTVTDSEYYSTRPPAHCGGTCQ
jgi:hypothetical protein